MAEVEPDPQILAALTVQLAQSRQQQGRLRDALTRVSSMLDEAEAT
ncbi:MAG: hypothetical protein ABI706_14875 [Ilumatobacteraceae bacterium]